MVLVALAGGVAIGGIAHLVSLLFYLIILFPIGMGASGGLVMGWAVKSGKVRNPLVASLFGLLMGVTIYGTMQGLGYWHAINKTTQVIRRTSPSLSQVDAVQAFNTALKQSTGLDGLPGYLALEANKGVNIGRIGPVGIAIGKTGTWIYWLVELAIIQYLVVARPRALAKTAFCETANEWYGDPLRWGNVEPDAADRFLELLKSAKFAAAGALINPQLQKVAVGSLEVYIETASDRKDCDVLCLISTAAVDKNDRLLLNKGLSGMLAPSEYEEMLATVPMAPDILDNTEIAYQEHDLADDQIADIGQQLQNYTAVQAAYLLKIAEIGGAPLTDTYQLGIIFDRQYITTDQDKSVLLYELSSEMETPGEAYVTLLNDDPASFQAIRQVVSQPFYHKQA